MKKYLWIAGGAILLISAFVRRNGISHARSSDGGNRLSQAEARKKSSKGRRNPKTDKKVLHKDRRVRRGAA
jgi:hypothetical protein